MQTAKPHTGSLSADRLEIRPLVATDRDRLADAFSHLSEETRRRRFAGLASRLSERDLDRLTKTDHHDKEAIAALAPNGQIVGVARYIALPDDSGAAEVAIAVDDEWQGRGIGRRLMSELVARARAEGITRLLAYVSADNTPVLGWIARVGGVTDAASSGASVYTIPLDDASAERTAA